jgi:hypothetical protein
MKTIKKLSENVALDLRSISEGDLEDVLFTFLGELHEERQQIAERRRNKFLDLLATLGPVEADQFLDVLTNGLSNEDTGLSSSPMVGEVIQKFMDIQSLSTTQLASKLDIATQNIIELLNEPYRVSEDGLKDVVTSLVSKHNIKNALVFRYVVATGYRLFALHPSTVGPVKIAARRKNK